MNRRQTPGVRATPDALADIDAAVEERCACGCGEPLPADGPSAWFVDATHQQRFHAARATNPAEVWSRPDAAPVYGDDQQRVPLEEPRASPAEFLDELMQTVRLVDALAARAFRRGPPVRALPLPGPSAEYSPDRVAMLRRAPGWQQGGMGWGRYCPACRHFSTPREEGSVVTLRPERIYIVDDVVQQRGLDPHNPSPMSWSHVQFCRDCGERLPGPPLVARWREDTDLAAVRYPIHLQLVAPLPVSQPVLYMRTMVAAEIAQEPDFLHELWRNLERDILDRLTFREPCVVRDCPETGRRYFESTVTVHLNRQDGNVTHWTPIGAGRWWLCPEHEYELRRQLPYPMEISPYA